jgi:hypothetical protein
MTRLDEARLQEVFLREDAEVRAKRGAPRSPRVDEDAKVISILAASGNDLYTESIVRTFSGYFQVSKEASKTRVTLALKKLVIEGRLQKVKQGVYRLVRQEER